MEGIDTLRSYEAIYDHGKMQWLGDQPVDVEARVIVTIFPNKTASSASGMKHQPAHWIAGKGKVPGDSVSPAASESDWNCLNDPGKSS